MKQLGMNSMFETMAPESDWEPPTELPNYDNAKLIGFDVETRDPRLLTSGPGGVRGDGEIVGFSLSADAQHRVYIPIRHRGGGNYHNPDGALRWLADVLRSNKPKVGASLLYDLEWAWTEGITVNGTLYDIQVAEPLIDENRSSYKLGSLGWKYLRVWKDETILNQAAAAFGLDPKGDLWQLHSKYVGYYGETDASLPIEVFNRQKKILNDQDLWDLFLLESDVLRVLFDMRIRGVRVDLDAAERLVTDFEAKRKQCLSHIREITGVLIDIWSSPSIERAFQAAGINYPRTVKNNASFTSDWLESHPDRLPQLIVEARQYDRAVTHVKAMVLDVAVGDRVHCQYYQLKQDDYGTVTGRFSSANPNLQQVPARHPAIGKAIRSLFIPEDGQIWCKCDYSQQEPRLTVHYAGLLELAGAQQAVEFYCNDPAADFHQMTADLAKIERRPAKDINLGMAYGLGELNLCKKMGLPTVWDEQQQREVPGDEGKQLFAQYHENVPWLKALQKKCMDKAQKTGWVKTLLGRRRRFNQWEDATKFNSQAMNYEAAFKAYNGRIRRAYCYRALNAIIQGSAADMIKKAMVDLWKAKLPITLTVHDEVDASVESPEVAKQMNEIMENAVKLTVPVKCDLELGPNWGEVKKQ